MPRLMYNHYVDTLDNTSIKTFLTLLIISLTCIGSIQAEAIDITFKQANQAYQAGDFGKAGKLYQKIISQGYTSFELYYNTGNAFFKNGNMADAVYHYEKASKLNPNESDLQHNLEVVQQKLTDKIVPLPMPFYQQWWNTLIHQASPDDWALSALIFSALVALFFTLYMASYSVILKKTYFGLFTLLAIVFFSLIFIAHASKEAALQPSAIIFSEVANVKSSPEEKSVDLFVLHEGTKVMVSDSIGSWNRIHTLDGHEGWLSKKAMRTI